jgi:hypothetical protein
MAAQTGDGDAVDARVHRAVPARRGGGVGLASADGDRGDAGRARERGELTATDVQAVLSESDDERAKHVRSYERAHKNRAGVLTAAERELTNA